MCIYFLFYSGVHFYLFKACLYDSEWEALDFVRTYEVFPQSLLDVTRVVPLPLCENLVQGKHVANPLWPLDWLTSIEGGSLLPVGI